MTAFDLKAHYRHPDYPGVAWYIDGFYKEKILTDVEYFDEEIGGWVCADWVEDEIEDTDQVYAIMVGDDRRFLFATDDMIKIEETDFCRECGQIGCGCVVYE